MEEFAKNRLAAVVLMAALGVWTACSDDATGPTQDDAPIINAAVVDPPTRVTGGGRVDFCCGSSEKNKSKDKLYQTWGLNVHSDLTGQFEFVDHREGNRPQCGGRPCNFHSVSFDAWDETDNIDCADGGIQVNGWIREKSQPETQYRFRLDVCDDGEPGHNRGNADRLELCIKGFVDNVGPAGADECTYHIRQFPTTPPQGAILTGGNTQVVS